MSEKNSVENIEKQLENVSIGFEHDESKTAEISKELLVNSDDSLDPDSLKRLSQNPAEFLSLIKELQSVPSKLTRILYWLTRNSESKVLLAVAKDKTVLKLFAEYVDSSSRGPASSEKISDISWAVDLPLQLVIPLISLVQEQTRRGVLDISISKLKSGTIASEGSSSSSSTSLKYLQLVLQCIGNEFLDEPSLYKLISIIARYGASPELAINSAVVLILAKCLELSPDKSQTALLSVTDDLLLQDTNSSLIEAFCLIKYLFHIDADIAAAVFATETVQSKQFTGNHLISEQLVIAALDTLSAACVNKACRALVAENYVEMVRQSFESKKVTVQLRAASVLIKIRQGHSGQPTQPNQGQPGQQTQAGHTILQLSLLFEQVLQNSASYESNDSGIALEGLAYSSLDNQVKQRVISNMSLVQSIIKVLNQTSQPPWIYCGLSILANLTGYPPKLSAEQAKLKDLKNYSEHNRTTTVSELEEVIDQRNKKILMDTDLIAVLSSNCPRYSRSSNQNVAIIMRNMVTCKAHRGEFAKKGGLIVVIYLLTAGMAESNKQQIDNKSGTIATSALAKTLISIDPSLALSSKVSLSVTVQPLLNQLNNEDSDAPLLDSFESLLALTNLASVNESCRNLIINNGWSKIETTMISSNTMIQRASIELICNLAMSPLCAEKFLDGSKAANSRLNIVAALTDLDDVNSRQAAMGTLAVLSEWGPAASVMGLNDTLVQRVIGTLNRNDIVPILLRALVALQNIVGDGSDSKVLEVLSNHGILQALRKIIDTAKDRDVVTTAVETVRVLAEH